LVLIDTLAVAWKALAKRGPYDDYVNVIEDDVAVETHLHLLENESTIRVKAQPLLWKAAL
ncbi:MAG TPA: hypothetical protein VE978_05200, partial [Chitinophagales bacterium]|nr:hypothetical protein [Chitinophagales bacterium]